MRGQMNLNLDGVYCSICGKKLTAPESIKRGCGKRCGKKYGVTQMPEYDQFQVSELVNLATFDDLHWYDRILNFFRRFF